MPDSTIDQGVAPTDDSNGAGPPNNSPQNDGSADAVQYTPTPAAQPQQTQPQPQPQQPTQQTNELGDSLLQQSAQMVSNSPVAAASSVHPSVQKASVVRDIAQTLAGGPRVSYSIDPQTGKMVQVERPLSTREIGMSIALAALSGGLSGMQFQGNNATAKSAGAGFAQGQQEQQQKEAQQRQQATQDYVRAAATANTNFQTHQNALRLGQMEKSVHDGYVADAKPALQALNDVGGILEHNVSEADLLPKYNVTKNAAIVDGTVPRMNADGSQATNKDGSLAWDNTYSVVDPQKKIAMPDETAQALAAFRVPGYFTMKDGVSQPVNLQGSAPIRAQFVLDGLQTLSSIKLTQQGVSSQLATLGKDGAADAQQFDVNLKQSIANGTVSPRSLKVFAKYASMPLDQAFDQMTKDKVSPTVIGELGSLIPYDAREQLKLQRTAKEEAQKASITTASDIAKAQALAPITIATRVAEAKALAPIQIGVAGAEERARQAARPLSQSLTEPDSLGFVPTVDAKTANSRFNSFKKNSDALSQTEGTYQQFNSILNDVNAGRGLSGAQSVVALFDSIGISATPLAGRGFRVSNNVIKEHAEARGWQGALQQKLLNVKQGDVITPDQVKSYANVAAQARESQYVNLVNQAHNAGISADPFLPTGNGQHVDPSTARIFLTLAGGDKAKARAAAQAKGWSF